MFKKETLKNIIPIRERYKKENFPDDKGHAECSLIVRKHNCISCINLMENWYYEIKHNSRRDQLSFNYVLWKQNDTNIKYISKVFIYQYFNQAPVHLKNFEFKDK